MRFVEFDSDKFVDDVANRLRRHCEKQECLRETGISTGTLYRITKNGKAPKDITTVLSLCAYLGLSIREYVRL